MYAGCRSGTGSRRGICPNPRRANARTDLDTLLVTAPFKHAGETYERGDRLPVRHRWVRRVADEQPELFAMEFAPEPVDRAWLAELEDD